MPRSPRRSSVLVAGAMLALGASAGCAGTLKAQQASPTQPAVTEQPAGQAQPASQSPPATPGPAPAQDTVVARVGDRVITLQEIEDKLRQLPDSVRDRIMKGNNLRVYLNNMVMKELFAREAEIMKIDQDPKVRARLEETRQDVLYNAISNRLLGDISVTEAEMQAYYEEHKVEFGGKAYQEVRSQVAQKLRDTKSRAAFAAVERDARARWPVTMDEAALKTINIPKGYSAEQIEKAIEEAERKVGPLPEETKKRLRDGQGPPATVVKPTPPPSR